MHNVFLLRPINSTLPQSLLNHISVGEAKAVKILRLSPDVQHVGHIMK